MDSDGEDDPAAIPELIKKTGVEVVEVKRGRRSEGLSFRISYLFYKVLFRIITGKTMDFGNYCMISKNVLERVCYTSFVHFPAYLLKQRVSKEQVVWDRARRLDGKSKMSFTGLFFHAFKSFIEFGEDLLMLFIKMFVIIMCGMLVLLGNIVYQKFFADTAILGWASSLGMGLLTLAVICIGFFILGILLLNLIHQQNRKNYNEIFNVIKS
jgi:hypothetical protein